MKVHPSKVYPQGRSQMALLILFCLVFFFLNLGQWDLWNPDEPRYAHVAREMMQRGDWILMHFNGRTYDDKPPFFFWMIALGSFLFGGINSFTARFPSAFFGTLTVLLTYLLGKRLYSRRTGLLGAFVLATSGEFFYLATRANIDATLTFFTTAALFCFATWDKSRETVPDKPSRFGPLSIYGFYVGMALATVTKGPVGIAVPLLVVLAYLFAKRDWKAFKEMKLPWGMMLTVGLVLCWYLPAVKRGGDAYLEATLFKQTIDRYSKGWSHVKPFYYYLINFPVEFLPWTVFLPSAIAYGFWKERRRGWQMPFFFLLTWFTAIFILFSISKGKRGLYLLPLYPASSLMIGALFENWISGQMERFSNEWVRIPVFVLGGVMAAGGPLALWIVWKKFPAFFGWSLPLAVLLTMAGLGLFFFNGAHKRGTVFMFIIMVVALGFFYTQRVVFPLVNPLKSARFLCEEITSRIKPGEPLAIYGGFGTGPYNYYTGIVPILELEKKEALSRFLQTPKRAFCLMRYRDYVSWISKEGREEVVFIARRQIGDDDIVLVSNR